MTKGLVKLTLVAAMALTASAASIPTFAADDCYQQRGWQQGEGRGWRRGEGRGWRQDMGQRQRGFMRRFQAIDANEDGKISDDEAASQRESVFLAMDANDDGELTEKEYMEIRMGQGEGRNKAHQAARQEQKRKRFAPMDADKSGTVSKAEWMTAGKAHFEAADANKDNIVTPWEFRSQHRG